MNMKRAMNIRTRLYKSFSPRTIYFHYHLYSYIHTQKQFQLSEGEVVIQSQKRDSDKFVTSSHHYTSHYVNYSHLLRTVPRRKTPYIIIQKKTALISNETRASKALEMQDNGLYLTACCGKILPLEGQIYWCCQLMQKQRHF